jgi:hypothetical protein
VTPMQILTDLFLDGEIGVSQTTTAANLLRPYAPGATSPEIFIGPVLPSTFKKGANSGGPPDFPGRLNRS